MSHVQVEFFGIPRVRAGVCSLAMNADTLGDLLIQLAARFPGLAESCLRGNELAPGYTANINGDRFTRDATTSLSNGDAVLILSLDAGG